MAALRRMNLCRHSDVFYTLNVLLGMSRVTEIPDSINLSEIFRCAMCVQLTHLPVPKYAFGMALWAAARTRSWNCPEERARAT